MAILNTETRDTMIPGSFPPRQPDLYVKDIGHPPASRNPSAFTQSKPPSSTPEDHIVIDNGSTRLRAGFSSHHEPYIDEPNLVAKYTSRKSAKMLLFGRDTEVDAASRVAQRSAFDGDVLANFDVLENVLDYTFQNLLSSFPSSSSSTNTIINPIIMTERLATPLYSRIMTSELLFEAYNVPSVTYGIDGLFAFESHWARRAGISPSPSGGSANGKTSARERGGKVKGREESAAKGKDGLVINLGNVTTSLIPVLDGRGVMNRAKRIPWGGSQAAELTLKLAQLKYPGFPTRVTPAQATYMFHETAYFSSSYLDETESLATPSALCAIDKICQFDYTVPEVNIKTEEELRATAERKKEQGKRLQEMQAKQRAERNQARELELMRLKDLLESKASLGEDDYMLEIIKAGFDQEGDVVKAIKNIEGAFKKMKNRNLPDDEVEETEEPTFPLVGIPDAELDEEQIKEKRKQRLFKANYDARTRLRAEKVAEKARVAEVARLDDESRETDLPAWTAKLRLEHDDTVERIKERKKTRAMLNDRKSAVAQNRMKSIAALASDAPPPKRRKKNGDDDGFGDDDADWAVYREIEGAEDIDAETDDLALILEIESKLLTHDPTFTQESTFESISNRQSALITAFLRAEGRYDPEDIAQNHQLHLNVERVRVPETWFQPGMAGVDSAGVGEIAGWLLNGFGDEERKRMMQCIYVTGGCVKIPNFTTRLHRELTSLLPFRSDINIVSSWPDHEPRHEAWKGMASWAGTEECKRAGVTKAEWEEMGGEYLKDHRWGNWADGEVA